MIEAYTYLLKHKESGCVYYGSRKASSPEDDLFKVYFSSSSVVERLIRRDGKESFLYEIRKVFRSYEKARLWETKVLSKMKVVSSDKWLNKSVSGATVCKTKPLSEQLRRENISKAFKLLWKDPEFRRKQTTGLSLESREKKRQAALKSGGTKKGRVLRHKEKYTCAIKPIYPPTSYFKLIKITKNGNTKIIHQNQLSAYKKYGWINGGVAQPGLEPTPYKSETQVQILTPPPNS